MSKRDIRLFLADMIESIEKIDRYTAGLTFERFADDDRTVDAVVRNLEIIGEAARQIPPAVQDRYPDIPWRRYNGDDRPHGRRFSMTPEGWLNILLRVHS